MTKVSVTLIALSTQTPTIPTASTTTAPLCTWATGCSISSDCLPGAVCVHMSQYTSQCQPDTTCLAANALCGPPGPAACCSGKCNSKTGMCMAATTTQPSCTYTKPSMCWRQAYAKNTVFLNTLSGPNGNNPNDHVQMGYVSQVLDMYPIEYFNGQPIITLSYAKELCDALTPTVCAAVQVYVADPEPINATSTVTIYPSWANLLTPLEYAWYKDKPQTLPAAAAPRGYAFERVPC